MHGTVPGGTMRWMLLLNTCGDPGEVALADLLPPDGGEAALLRQGTFPGREAQESLLPALTELLTSTGLTIRDVHVVAVITGPGSFTGIRIGLAAAKGLAEALCIPLIVLSRLAVLASQAGAAAHTEAWLDAGRGGIFRGRYSPADSADEGMLAASHAVAELADSGAVVMEQELLLLSPLLRLVAPVGVRQALPLAVQKVRNGDFTGTVLADANYLRVPDAELALRARLSVPHVA